MKTSKFAYFFILLFSLVLFSSCESDAIEIDTAEEETEETEGTEGTDTTIEITVTEFTGDIDENSANETSLGNAVATTNEGTLSFNIDSQDPEGAVSIDAATGELSIANESFFDFESYTNITGVISATVASTSENLNFTITINDVVEVSTPLIVSTLAGSSQGDTDGDLSIATFNKPKGVALDSVGNIYVIDTGNHALRKITPEGVVSTLAGGTAGYLEGTGTTARFNSPSGIIMGNDGFLYVADTNNNRIRKISLAGTVNTLAGRSSSGFADGTGQEAKFDEPTGLTMDADGNIYVTDIKNQSIRKITSEGVVTTLAGNGTSGYADGTGTEAEFKNPTGIVLNSNNELLVSDYFGRTIRKVSLSGVVTTWAGSGVSGSFDRERLNSSFGTPSGIAVDAQGDILVSDRTHNNIRKISSTIDVVTTLAGFANTSSGNIGDTDGSTSDARFYQPAGMVVAPDGTIYIADSKNHRIRVIK